MELKRIVGLTGNYGSGKTELAINLALFLATQRKDINIIDLDIVNPYFRCREARELMKSQGIRVIIPEGDQVFADLPIIVPEIKGAVKSKKGTLILDIGGNDVGAKVLSHLSDSLMQDEFDLLMVLNGNRPFTETKDGAIKIMDEIENSSKFKITGILCNTHLIEFTTRETIMDGYKLACEVKEATGLPIIFVAIEEKIVSLFDEGDFDHPIFPVKRYMLPPWGDSKESKEYADAKSAN